MLCVRVVIKAGSSLGVLNIYLCFFFQISFTPHRRNIPRIPVHILAIIATATPPRADQ